MDCIRKAPSEVRFTCPWTFPFGDELDNFESSVLDTLDPPPTRLKVLTYLIPLLRQSRLHRNNFYFFFTRHLPLACFSSGNDSVDGVDKGIETSRGQFHIHDGASVGPFLY